MEDKILNPVSNSENQKAMLSFIDCRLADILNILDYDLDMIKPFVKKLSSIERQTMLVDTINKLLANLKSEVSIEDYYQNLSKINTVTNYFTTAKDSNGIIYDNIADDIFLKVRGNPLSDKELPLTFDKLKEELDSSQISELNIEEFLLRITIRYLTISKCIKWWQDNLEDC